MGEQMKNIGAGLIGAALVIGAVYLESIGQSAGFMWVGVILCMVWAAD